MNVKLGVCFQDRFAADSVRLKELISAGGLGKVVYGLGKSEVVSTT